MPTFTKRETRRPALRWSSVKGELSYRVVPLGEDEWVDQPIGVGTRGLADYFGTQHGGVRFHPTFDRKLVPYSEPTVSTPDDLGEDGKPAYAYTIVLPIHIPELTATLELMGTGKLMTGALADLLDLVTGAPECAKGLVPIVEYTGSSEIKPKAGPVRGKTFFVPKLVIQGWAPRSDLFGPAVNHPSASLPLLRTEVAMPTVRGGKTTLKTVRLPPPFLNNDLDDALPF
jgi:hypothetical protein